MSDGPFYEIAAEVEGLLRPGVTIFQKFTCEACLERQVMSRPNVLYKTGKCDECGHVTNLELRGCGFMLISSSDITEHEALIEGVRASIESAQPRNRN